VVARNPFDGKDYEDVGMGNTNQAGEDARNLARHAGLLAGLPQEVAGVTVNRLCGSGLAAILDAARAVKAGEGELFVAGGAESMSRASFVIAKSVRHCSLVFTAFNITIGACFRSPELEKPYGVYTTPNRVHNVAAEARLNREEAGTNAARSQALYAKARAEGFFDEESHPI